MSHHTGMPIGGDSNSDSSSDYNEARPLLPRAVTPSRMNSWSFLLLLTTAAAAVLLYFVILTTKKTYTPMLGTEGCNDGKFFTTCSTIACNSLSLAGSGFSSFSPQTLSDTCAKLVCQYFHAFSTADTVFDQTGVAGLKSSCKEPPSADNGMVIGGIVGIIALLITSLRVACKSYAQYDGERERLERRTVEAVVVADGVPVVETTDRAPEQEAPRGYTCL